MFSTTTTEPSTTIPMAIAKPPSDMRLAEIPNHFMAINARHTEKGIDRATTRLGRQPPIKASNTIATKAMTCSSALDTVEHAASTRHTSELQSRGHLVCRLLLE